MLSVYKSGMKALFALLFLAAPSVAAAQLPVAADTAAADSADDTSAHRSLWARGSRASGLAITTGKTYNRVEGLPVHIGPVFRDSIGAASLQLSVLGIIRSARTFHWDAGNIGHRVNAEYRVGRGRGYSLGLSSFDIVEPVETWQLADPDAALAALFARRDFRDYFGRHGAKAAATLNTSKHSSFGVEWSDERWSSRDERSTFTVFRNGARWRANPGVDDGRFHIAVARAKRDTRNDVLVPTDGVHATVEYERGTGSITSPGAISLLARDAIPNRVAYGRVLLDARSYNRASPSTQLNGRLVLGGWLHGDQLPLQRRFSVGGIGSIPGFDYRKAYDDVDVSQCNSGGLPPQGNPAQCERVVLAQLEYRAELHSSWQDFLNARPIRLRGIGFTVRPAAVAFVDAGRGWLVGERDGKLRYPSGTVPAFGTWRTDIGLGLDLGFGAIYVAKAVSRSKEPANVFLRLRRRF